LFPEHGLDGEELLQRADVAMYQAKGARTGSELYARERDTHSRERFALVGDLRAALENGEIGPHFQPIAESGTRRIVGVEALVRWRHPERGMLSPAIFLPLAEQAGLMRTLTRRVLGDALAACRVWRDVGHDLHVSVNVTATDLLDAELPIEIAAALADHDLPAEVLVVEITESSVMSDPVRIGEVLARLADLGVGLSLDDFGTGYSSLTHLRALPVGEIKVDRSFVGRMATDSADAVIVRATIRLAHDLGMRVVAEGVEDEATWAQLAALGAELVQGYALGRPVPAAELELSRPTRAAAPAAR
jgi:EAL domain-containing protein (putative c-di-GMP-specific phosphodiesterase class I)